MTENNVDRFLAASQENFTEMQRKIKTNNVVRPLQMHPEIKDTYSPTELDYFIIPQIKQACNMEKLPVYYHTDARKSKWAFRHLIHREVNHFIERQYAYKFKTINNVPVPMTQTVINLLNESTQDTFYGIALDLRAAVVKNNLEKQLIYMHKCYTIIENSQSIDFNIISRLPGAPCLLKLPANVQFVHEILWGIGVKQIHKIRINLSIAKYNLIENELSGWKDGLDTYSNVNADTKIKSLEAHPYYETKQQINQNQNVKWSQMQIETPEINYLKDAKIWYDRYLDIKLTSASHSQEILPFSVDFAHPPTTYKEYLNNKKQFVNYRMNLYSEYTQYKEDFPEPELDIDWDNINDVKQHLLYFVHCLDVQATDNIILTVPLINLQLKLIELLLKYGFFSKNRGKYKQIECDYVQRLMEPTNKYTETDNDYVDHEVQKEEELDCYQSNYLENFLSAKNQYEH
eukprot:264578_1